ncbi:MAG TPA: hypothetical protein VK092_05270 [Deinococcales bacterium]|nr:hypothetical protein [Deinococcales bacterium]
MTDLDEIRAFLAAMRERHEDQIENIELPAGTDEFIGALVEAGDTDELLFALKLSYLMGLNTGFALAQATLDDDDDDSGDEDGPVGPGPLKA